MKRALFLLAAPLAMGVAAAAFVACSGDTIKAPASDKNFDDPDDPGQTGAVGAQDATTVPLDGGDAAVQVPVCDGSPSCEPNFDATTGDAGDAGD